jgi:signal transduction histidine kinase
MDDREEPPSRPVPRGWLLEVDEELAEAEFGARRLLDLARGIEIPTESGSAECVDVSEVLRLSLRLMQSELRRVGSLEIDVRPVPAVVGTAGQLGQIILNLLVNAVSGVSALPRDRRRFSVHLGYAEPWVRVEFADSGPGFSSELLSKGYELFSRGEGQGGFGLGLAISKTIVEELGGRLEAENRPDGGVAIRVLLPKQPGPAPLHRIAALSALAEDGEDSLVAAGR